MAGSIGVGPAPVRPGRMRSGPYIHSGRHRFALMGSGRGVNRVRRRSGRMRSGPYVCDVHVRHAVSEPFGKAGELDGMHPVGPGYLAAQARRRQDLSRVAQALRVECPPEPVHDGEIGL